MNPSLTFATAGRVLTQLRRDHRTLAMILVIPCVLVTLIKYVVGDDTWARIGLPLVGARAREARAAAHRAERRDAQQAQASTLIRPAAGGNGRRPAKSGGQSLISGHRTGLLIESVAEIRR